MLLVVALRLLLSGVQQLEADQLESLLLESLDDVSYEAALDAVGFDCDEGALILAASDALGRYRCRSGLTQARTATKHSNIPRSDVSQPYA